MSATAQGNGAVSPSRTWQTALKRRRRPLEWVAERCIFLIALSAILVIFLIFLFVAREAWPVAVGRMSTAAVSTNQIIPVEAADTVPADQLARYLGLSLQELAGLSAEVKRELMQVKAEELAHAPSDKDAPLNALQWRYLLAPHQWTGYDRPEYIWQPVSPVPKFNLVPLVVGSLKTTLVALVFAVPLALGAALYVSQLAPRGVREYLKPAVEMLAGIPSVVLGFFALIVMASVLQRLLGYESRLNAFVAGIALGLAVIPLVFSVAEDALTSVPRQYTEAALALGSTKWQCAWQIVLPAAVPGVFAAVVLGFGRAIGETMIVLMASGNATIISWNIFDSARTMTATIAAELAETVFGGPHYRILFLVGALLFVVTFISNLVADLTVRRLKERMEGRPV